MLSSSRLATVFLALAILLPAQNTNPAGKTATQKNSCDEASSQWELNQCSGQAFREADARLNALYANVISLIARDIAAARKENDADKRTFNETALQKLKATERAWIQYQDLRCDAARDQIEGGSMAPMVWANCMEEITSYRIKELKDAYEIGDIRLE